jgi:hypothetical protein
MELNERFEDDAFGFSLRVCIQMGSKRTNIKEHTPNHRFVIFHSLTE